MDYALGIIIIVVVIAIGVWVSRTLDKKRANEAWTGTVVKKWLASYSDEDGEVSKVPTLQIQIDGGKKKKISVGAQTFNSLSEGDKVKKVAGERDPAKA